MTSPKNNTAHFYTSPFEPLFTTVVQLKRAMDTLCISHYFAAVRQRFVIEALQQDNVSGVHFAPTPELLSIPVFQHISLTNVIRIYLLHRYKIVLLDGTMVCEDDWVIEHRPGQRFPNVDDPKPTVPCVDEIDFSRGEMTASPSKRSVDGLWTDRREAC
jgi:hypothetical protein